MRRRSEKRTTGVAGDQPAVVVPDGSRWADLEIGDRSEQTFLLLYESLPEAALYCTDGYPVYGCCRRIVTVWARVVR